MFKKYLINPTLNWLDKRWPGLKFLREYSPKNLERIEFLRKVMNFVKDSELDGDYLEFGVYKGANFITAMAMAKAKKLNSIKFYAFDSFRGLPEAHGVDKEFEQFKGGGLAFDLDKFKKRIGKRENVIIVPGFFQETLNDETKKKLGIKSAAVVWIDCDMYESAVPVFNFITDFLVDGTILVLDDWFLYRGNPDRGEQRAFREWLAKNPDIKVSEFHKYFWHGNSFIVHTNTNGHFRNNIL